nr:MAG TPA_asm: hypothetical protein [Caudoviricetes sp.]
MPGFCVNPLTAAVRLMAARCGAPPEGEPRL